MELDFLALLLNQILWVTDFHLQKTMLVYDFWPTPFSMKVLKMSNAQSPLQCCGSSQKTQLW